MNGAKLAFAAAIALIILVVAWAVWPSSSPKKLAVTHHHATCWTPEYASSHNPTGVQPAPRHGKGPHGVDVCDKGANG